MQQSSAIHGGSLPLVQNPRTRPATPTLPFPLTQIKQEANDVAAREPFLEPFLRGLILACDTPAEMLAMVLTRRLCQGLPEETALRQLVQQILSDEQSIVEQASADLRAVTARDPACASYLHAVMNLKGFHALQVHRVSHYLWQHDRQEIAYWLSNRSSLVLGVDIHPAVRVGMHIMLDHGSGIVMGETAVIDDHVSILQNVTLGGTGKECGDRHPKIRRGVMIGAGAKILGNIEIGTMSKVAAGSVVLFNVPPHCTVAGVPARVVRHHQADFPADEMNQTF